jgi:hypothetical protein
MMGNFYSKGLLVTDAGHAECRRIAARDRIELEIERLIALLDAFDGDAELEAAGDELDASYPEGWQPAGAHPVEDDEDTDDDQNTNVVTLNPRRNNRPRYVTRRRA